MKNKLLTPIDITQHEDTTIAEDSQAKTSFPSMILAEMEELDIHRKSETLAILEDALIDLNQPIIPPPICFEIWANDNSYNFGTLGNFSLIIGKAKSRKTFFVGVLIAAALKQDIILDTVQGLLPDGKKTILYFDTEQAQYKVQQVAKRVLSLVGIDTQPINYKVFGLRKYTPNERLSFIQTALECYPEAGIVVIDGIRDLLSSINDEEQATLIASCLLKWTEEGNRHIITVLHQNKGDENARGHLGTELVNKAETVVAVSTKDEITEVKPVFCRDREFPPFYFSISEDGLPQIENKPIEGSGEGGKRSKTTSPYDIEIVSHIEVLKEIAPRSPKTYQDLLMEVINTWSRYGIKFGDSVGKRFITHYSAEGWVTSLGKGKGYRFSLPPII